MSLVPRTASAKDALLQRLGAGMGMQGAARRVMEDSEQHEAKSRRALVPVSYRNVATQLQDWGRGEARGYQKVSGTSAWKTQGSEPKGQHGP